MMMAKVHMYVHSSMYVSLGIPLEAIFAYLLNLKCVHCELVWSFNPILDPTNMPSHNESFLFKLYIGTNKMKVTTLMQFYDSRPPVL